MSESFQHISVLLNESIDGLAIKPDGIYIDGTFGRGGHSRTILSTLGENGRLYSIDRDPQAIAEAVGKKSQVQAAALAVGVETSPAQIFDSMLNECGAMYLTAMT